MTVNDVRLMSMHDVARYLGCGLTTVKLNQHLLPGRRYMGRKVLFDKVEIDRLVDKLEESQDFWVAAAKQVANV